MTEQEAEVLAARLVRIWMPEQLNVLPARGKNYPQNDADFQGVFWDFEFTDWRSICLMARVDFQALLIVDQSNYGPHYEFSLVGKGDIQGKISCEMSGVRAAEIRSLGQNRDQRDFVVTWLHFFRRGCWLSGCDIEASAHEKAEWIQGFNREEIEAWNLKI